MLAACKEEKRDNPLLSKDIIPISNWLLETYGEEIEVCGIRWADPQKVSKAELEYCRPTAKKIATEMNDQGFLQDVRPDDLNVPLIWRNFTQRLEANRSFKKKSEASTKEMKKLLRME